ncbi:hypothetical protein LMH87_012276 [Akanthomyces muscarius]|uniref:RBP protein n=1 Tax=Akanthomyces muscarius TaxID=2231603 RepID=A0A9W8QBG7_AKAMU|nr:hypothetical protein LMH87_012276 [Akanthomyces muscarius]KAJ4151586.1 hypothetical protein LMH87_012276 [Akanthomyces muscarius]
MAAAVSVPLPAHALAMDVPRKSELIVSELGDQGYCWVLTDTERAHIATMLETDVSEINLRGNVMDKERFACESCGKHSGLDDLVHNALYGGVHSIPFMLGVLVDGPHGESPAHELVCSRCTTKHKHSARWLPRFMWKWN